MRRITLTLFTSCLLSLSAFAQTTPDCSTVKGTDPIVPEIAQADGREHQSGVTFGHTGSTLSAGNSLVASCSYSNPPSGGSTCQTTCVVLPSGIPPATNDINNLIVSGQHEVTGGFVNGPAISGAGAVSCTAGFAITVLNLSEKGTTTTVYAPAASTVTLSCPAVPVPTPTPTPTPTPAPTPVPTPIPTPTPTPIGSKPGQPCDNDPSGGGTGGDKPDFVSGCSPIIIDVEGQGFHLTSAAAGVTFDISGTGTPIRIAWTDPVFHNGFLALPGADGLVHNGKQLFGNFTSQPASIHPNGFLALSEYDKPENGGNGDGIIDEKDAIFLRLRLWIDENHDGICQPNELYLLPEMNIYSLALGYFASNRTDEFGNQFRYKGRVNPDQRRDQRDETPTGNPGRWAYDVFFATVNKK